MKKLDVLILAAGSGKRFNSNTPKTYLKLNGFPLIYYSINSFSMLEDVVNSIYIVISKDMEKKFIDIKNRHLSDFKKLKGYIIGGDTRQQSVYNGLFFLKKLKDEERGGYVAIHDGARPFIKPALINNIFNEAAIYGGASCGVKPVDTVKIVNDGIVKTHLKRDNLINIQTPQIFLFNKIFDGYEYIINNGIEITDDTEAFSYVNGETKIVQGDNDLIKITYKEDLKKAREILKRFF